MLSHVPASAQPFYSLASSPFFLLKLTVPTRRSHPKSTHSHPITHCYIGPHHGRDIRRRSKWSRTDLSVNAAPRELTEAEELLRTARNAPETVLRLCFDIETMSLALHQFEQYRQQDILGSELLSRCISTCEQAVQESGSRSTRSIDCFTRLGLLAGCTWASKSRKCACFWRIWSMLRALCISLTRAIASTRPPRVYIMSPSD